MPRMDQLWQDNQIPFALVNQPSELFDDEHLVKGKHLYDTELVDGYKTTLPKLPIRMSGLKLDSCTPPPQIGEHSDEILSGLGYSIDSINDLREKGRIF